MEATKNPHDALFKQVFSQTEHAVGLLRHILPPTTRDAIDWTALHLEPGSFVDTELQDHHTDLLFTTVMDGHPALIYVLFEHQSTADPLMPMRLLRYMTRIWAQFLLNQPQTTVVPVILPVVLHHSERGWMSSTAFSALYDLPAAMLALVQEHVPQFRFFLDDISASSDTELCLRVMTALGRLALCCFRYSRNAKELFSRLQGWVSLLNEVRRAPNGLLALAAVSRYMWSVTKPGEREEATMLLKQLEDPGLEREILSAADLFWEEGRQEGQRALVERLLTWKFKDLPAHALEAVKKASLNDLEAMAERILTAQTLAEVLGG